MYKYKLVRTSKSTCFQLFAWEKFLELIFKILRIFIDLETFDSAADSKTIKKDNQNSFRVPLVCTLLDNLHEYLTNHQLKKQTLEFLI